MKMSDKIGSIEVGRHADMIVLDQNLFELEEAGRLDRISHTNVLTTIFDGKVVYDAMKDPKPKTRPAH
jgi:predicted amidohydrolase YtcJ